MKAIRELLELPDAWRDDMEEAPIQDYDFGWNNCAQNCANELQSALEAADIEGLVKRIEELEGLLGKCRGIRKEQASRLVSLTAQLDKVRHAAKTKGAYLTGAGILKLLEDDDEA